MTQFDSKPQQINKVLVHKYFWHTFRFADVQWIQAPVDPSLIVVRDNGLGGRSFISTLESLRA